MTDTVAHLLINRLAGWTTPPAKTRAAVPSEVWGRELSGRAADSARGLRLKLLKCKVHCSNPLVTGSNPVGGANFENSSIAPAGTPERVRIGFARAETFFCDPFLVTTFLTV